MKFQVRKGVFETNSSSVHSITMCSASDFDKWENGELVYDRWERKLIPITEEIKSKMENDIYSDYYTFDDFFNNYERMDLETFCDSFKTASGEEVVAFGYHGHD